MIESVALWTIFCFLCVATITFILWVDYRRMEDTDAMEARDTLSNELRTRDIIRKEISQEIKEHEIKEKINKQEEQRSEQSSIVTDHLIILAHGLHGRMTDLMYIKQQLVTEHPNLLVHCATCNDGFLRTHEGVDSGGKKLADEIEEFAAKHPQIKKFSIIGHSLGGIFARYCIGILHERRFFDKYQPVYYVSLASPHVGSRRSPKGLFNPLACWFTRSVLSITGKQLMLEDGDTPLLVELTKTDGIFYKGLSLFSHRILYANVLYDVQVPYSTASIMPKKSVHES